MVGDIVGTYLLPCMVPYVLSQHWLLAANSMCSASKTGAIVDSAAQSPTDDIVVHLILLGVFPTVRSAATFCI